MRISSIITVFTYLCVLVTTILVWSITSLSVTLIFISAAVIGIFLDLKRIYPISRKLLNVLAVLIVITTLFRISTQDPLPQIMEVVLLLLGIKLVEEKRFRDYMQIYLLCLFCFAGAAFFTFSIKFLFYFLSIFLMISISSTLLTTVNFSHDEKLNKSTCLKTIASSALIPLTALPLATVIFLILPRPMEPIFSFLYRKGAASGFNDIVSLGEVSSIQESDITIMRVKVPELPSNYLYWRGITLDYFDGRRWRKSGRKKALAKLSIFPQKFIKQIIYLEPYGEEYLFALDTPIIIKRKGVKALSDFTFKLPYPILKRISYVALSSPQIHPQDVPNESHLQLPPNLPEEIKILSKKLCVKDPLNTIKNVTLFFKTNFSYTLKELPVSKEPLKEFLKSKKGNCEFFASAAALILRTCKIPARLVAGFKGGEYNQLGGYYRISQKHAHVWTEAYINGLGWIRLEPTPQGPIVRKTKTDIATQIRKFMDLINYYWIMFVVNYDIETQLSLLKKLNVSFKKIKSIGKLREKLSNFKYATFLIVVAIICLKIQKLFTEKEKEEDKLVRKFLKKLEYMGYKKRKEEGLEEFVLKISDPKIRMKALHFVKELEPVLYYNKKLTSHKRSILKKIIDSL